MVYVKRVHYSRKEVFVMDQCNLSKWPTKFGVLTSNANKIQWKPLIMITLGLALFDNNNRLITLSGGYKNLHYSTQFIVTVQPFTCIKTTKFILKNLRSMPVVCLPLVVPE
jgi:hypothetical protein